MKNNIIIIFLFVALAGVILWQALLPGYILSLDMIFTPTMGVLTNPDGFLNFLPVSHILHWLSQIIPSWIVQKATFVFLFSILGYLAYKFLPVGEDKNVRLFSALLYLSNPFVYVRFLAGHWTYLMAYSFLPLFLHHLFALQKTNDRRSCFKFCGALFLIGVFSVHLFILAVLASFIWIFYLLIRFFRRKEFIKVRTLAKNICLAGFVLLLASSYWMVPAFFRPAPLEQRFGYEHWQAFSAGGYKNINPLLNVASLNGFWGERNAWAKYFLWLQDYTVFWVAYMMILVLVLLGVCHGIKNLKTKPQAIFMVGAGLTALIFAVGVGDTIFKQLNLWLYEHVYFWSGFRDSHKFSAVLALSYAFFAGFGLEWALAHLPNKKPMFYNFITSFILLIPIFFGLLMWGGFHGQLQPVWYPTSWFAARDIINQDPSAARILVLPWHGYLSLNFNNNLITSNPAKRFFGERAVVSQNVELGDVYNQEKNQSYADLDDLIKNEATRSEDEVLDFFLQRKIKYIIHFQDLKTVDSLHYEFLNSDRLKKIITENDLVMYEIENNKSRD